MPTMGRGKTPASSFKVEKLKSARPGHPRTRTSPDSIAFRRMASARRTLAFSRRRIPPIACAQDSQRSNTALLSSDWHFFWIYYCCSNVVRRATDRNSLAIGRPRFHQLAPLSAYEVEIVDYH